MHSTWSVTTPFGPNIWAVSSLESHRHCKSSQRALLKMSEDPVGVCCSIALVACLDVCAGVCIDFASFSASLDLLVSYLRHSHVHVPEGHSFTETMFRCNICGRTEKERTLEGDERAPLIQQIQPTASRPMLADG